MNNIPKSYKKYFWDCNFNDLNLAEHKIFILNRFLSFGDIEGIKFITNNYSQKEVRRYITTKGAKALSHNNLFFWQKLVKHEELWRR